MRVLRSPRWRRRLAWGGGALVLAGLAVGIGIAYPDSTPRDPARVAADQARDAYVYREPKRIQLTKADRARALATAANFVTHAVARRKVDQAYDLTHPALRAGISLAEWHTGNIPVVPFPVEQARWRLEYTYEDGIGLQVVLYPTRASRLRPESFDMELTAAGTAANHRFLVKSWAPSTVAAPGSPAGASAVGPGGTRDLSASLDGPARLDQRWLLAPFALFALVPLALVGFFVRGWLHGRRVASEYASSSPPRGLPTLRR